MQKTFLKNKRKWFVATLLLVFIFTLLCSVLQIKNLAFAESVKADTKVESPMDSDFIQGFKDLTIRDYPDILHATKAAVRQKENGGFELSNLNEDDPIVAIIPKEYFFTVGQILKIGDEYGYFIETIRSTNNNFTSKVMVFDITTNTDLEATTDRVIVEVEPIFQYKYAGLTNSTNVEIMCGFYLSYDALASSCVVAYPTKMENYTFVHTLEYDMIEDYYIKDIIYI